MLALLIVIRFGVMLAFCLTCSLVPDGFLWCQKACRVMLDEEEITQGKYKAVNAQQLYDTASHPVRHPTDTCGVQCLWFSPDM